jgi:hypothetical protein
MMREWSLPHRAKPLERGDAGAAAPTAEGFVSFHNPFGTEMGDRGCRQATAAQHLLGVLAEEGSPSPNRARRV